MGRLKTAASLEALGLAPREGIELAKRLGLDGVELATDGGDFAPEMLSLSGRRHLLKFLADRRVAVAALNADARNIGDIEQFAGRFRAVVDLAVGLHTAVIELRIGEVPPEDSADERDALLWIAREIGGYAANYARWIAVRTPPQAPVRLREFIKAAGSEAIGVSYDPAGQVAAGLDPVAGVFELARAIEYVRANDAVRHDDGNCEAVPVGTGAVPYERLVNALDEHNYEGSCAIRVTGADAADELAAAADILRAY